MSARDAINAADPWDRTDVASPKDSERPLRITVLAPGLRVGGGYTVGLNLMAAFGRVAPEHEYFWVVPAGMAYEDTARALPRCRWLAFRQRGYVHRWRFENFGMAAAVREFRPDVILGLGGRGLLRPGCAQAVFPQQPHLFYPARYSGNVPLRGRLLHRYNRHYFAKQLRYTQLVLVQTEVVEKRLREVYRYRGRTLVCSTSVSPFLAGGKTGCPVPEPLRAVGGQFKLLYVTRYYGHKNVEGILELFRQHRQALRDVLIVTTIGPEQHPNARRYVAAIAAHRLGDQIINVGAVPHSGVGAYYEHCDALFMPTLLETFGIPYLEAMCFGLPVMTSDLDFAHAVCGDAALYFDPWHTASMRAAILELKSNEALRQRLVAAGRQRVTQRFPSWDEIARDMLKSLCTIVREWKTARDAPAPVVAEMRT